MKIRTIGYSIKQGIKNIRRNSTFSLASIGTIMACLFLFGIFYFVVFNFQHMVKTAETSVGITIFFDKGLSEDRIKEIGEEIGKRTEVKEIKYISPEEAWEKCQQEFFKGKENELMATYGDDNPLADSASYEIYVTKIEKQNSLVKYISSLDGVRQINHSDTVTIGLKNINLLVGYTSGAIIIILLSVAVFLISTTVTMGITVRKDEIAIMKLIGATDIFIRAPFVVEGVIIGFIGAAFPLVILYFIYDKAIIFIADKFDVLSDILVFLNVNQVFRSLIPISLFIGIGIGLFGSIVTVRKHLKV